MSAKKVIKAIKSYSRFLITSHIDLEGDALGSELALASLLRKLGKKTYIVNHDRAPFNYRFLTGTKKICYKLNSDKFQAAFILDCPDSQRIGRVTSIIGDQKPMINIDHHIGNKNFGKINWVEPKASCIGEMIYRLFALTRTKLDKGDALNIYTAILTDTGSFRHANTTSNTFHICSNLLRFGIEPAKIYSRIYENNSAKDIALVARAISRMSFAANNKIAWIKIGKVEFARMRTNPEISARILDFAKSVNTVKVIIIFCQLNKRLVKVSLRSKSPVDVQKIALVFGGGGHRFASGCTIKAGFEEAQRALLKQVKRII